MHSDPTTTTTLFLTRMDIHVDGGAPTISVVALALGLVVLALALVAHVRRTELDDIYDEETP